MRILVLDDETIALEGLKRSIAKAAPDAEIVGFQSAATALAWLEYEKPDVIFSDIQMAGMDGLTFGRTVKQMLPRIDIVFVTGFIDYMKEAFDMYASGYLTKPVTAARVREALDNLRFREAQRGPRVRIQCFGSFEVFCDDKPIQFQLKKTKELFAYLVDRRGAVCSLQMASTVIFEDDNHDAYIYKLRGDLVKTMEALGCGDVITHRYGHLSIVPEKVDCDYYRWLERAEGERAGFSGEYMSQYSWAEFTLAGIENQYSDDMQ